MMEPDRGMNASASPSMARVVKERTGNPPRDPVCVFVYAVSGKHHDAFGTDVREFGDHHILTAEGPGEVWGFIMKFDGATEACL